MGCKLQALVYDILPSRKVPESDALSVVQFKRPVLPKLEAFPSALTYRYGLQWGRLSIVQFKRPELEVFLSAMGKA